MKIISVFKKAFAGSHFKKSYYKQLLVGTEDAAADQSVHIRRGYVTFYVGPEEKRYQVPVKFVSFPPLLAVMKESYDDVYDVKIDGPIKLACTPKQFEDIIKRAKNRSL